jgi:hypothetical protein
MTRTFFSLAFLLGMLAVLWIGKLFLGSDNLGLAVTVLIGGVYLLGVFELLQFRRATISLHYSLNDLLTPVDDLYQWLIKLDPSLQNAVRLRVEGERNALPAPVVTPYLVSLLVMLGLLGTFVGMVDTLRGAVVALEGSNELEAIRAGLTAPIEGLGLAFGTTVAGVAASAMLGLLSTISRRERVLASHLLDTKIGRELREFSGTHRQQLAFQAMHDQANGLPAVAQQLSKVTEKLDKMGDTISERLFSNQAQFQNTIIESYKDFADSVSTSLKENAIENARSINDNVHDMVDASLTAFSSTALASQKNIHDLNKQQLEATVDNTQKNSALLREVLEASLLKQTTSTSELVELVTGAMEVLSDEFQTSANTMLQNSNKAAKQAAKQALEHASDFTLTVGAQLGSLREEEAARGTAALERLSELESVVTKHLSSLGIALEAPMARLIETASHTPKAAADVIEKLRDEMTKNFERDNDLLSERTRLMQQLDTLSAKLEESSNDQRDAVTNLVERSEETLTQLGSQYSARMDAEYSKLGTMVEHFSSSSIEMASLGDAFNSAVALFSESNNQLIENLSSIETSLEQAGNRNDEQLAYYVAQAREIIDHNLLSHKEIIDAVRVQSAPQASSKRDSK